MTQAAIQSGPERGGSGGRLIRLLGWPWRAVAGAVGLAFNPVVSKELKVSARRKRTYLLRAAYLLLLVSVLLLTWWALVQDSMSTSQADLLQRQSETGRTLSLTLGWIQLIALILIAPMLTGSCVSDEIEDRSLDVLLITPLSAGQIVIGKMLSRFIYVVLLVLLAAPLLLAMRTYGGFSLEQLIQIEVLSLTTALLGSSIAILLSCWEARGWRAVAMTYFWLAIWWFAAPLALVAAALMAVDVVREFFPWMTPSIWLFEWEAYPLLMLHTNPIMTMAMVSAGAFMTIPWPTQYTVVTVSIINVSMSGVLLLLAVPLLRRTANRRAAGAERSRRGLLSRLLRIGRSRGEPARPAAAPPRADRVTEFIEGAEPGAPPVEHQEAVRAACADLAVPRVWEHAVLWREMRFNMARRPTALVLGSLLVLALVMWYNSQAELASNVGMLIPVIWIGAIAQLVIAAVVSPTVIASEKQARSWDVLMCAPMQPLGILCSKAAGALKYSLVPLAALLLELLYYSASHPLLLVALQVAIISTGFAVFLACTGTALSLWCKRSMTAMAGNISLALLIWMGLPTCVGLFFGMRGGSNVERLIGATMVINPFYWLAVVSSAVDSISWNMHATYQMHFWGGEVSSLAFTGMLALTGTVMAGAGFGVLYACATWFNCWTGRSS